MWGAYSSEWVKLQRRSMLGWGFGGGLFFPVLATIFTIERATKTLVIGPHGGVRVTIAALEQPTGLVHGVVDVSSLIGIVSLCIFAGAFATEYSQGTLRNLLVREPRRTQLLSGKFLALVTFIAIVVIVAVGVAVAVAFALGVPHDGALSRIAGLPPVANRLASAPAPSAQARGGSDRAA